MAENAPQSETQQSIKAAPWSALVDRAASAWRAANGWVDTHRRMSVIAGGILLLGCSLVATMTAWWLQRPETAELGSVDAALEHLDAGRFAEAREASWLLLGRQDLPADQRGVPAYTLGAAAAFEAQQNWDQSKQTVLYELAARYLKEAYDRGIPPGREADAAYLMAKSLFHAGRYVEARVAIDNALTASPGHRTELHRLMAQAHYRAADPDLDAASTWNTRYLADRTLSPKQRDAAHLLESQIHFRRQDFQACDAALKRIDAESSLHADALVVAARLRMHQGDRLAEPSTADDAEQPNPAAQAYGQAIQMLQEAEAWATLDNPVRSKSALLIGVCLRKSGEMKAALKHASKTRQTFHDTPEGVAATLEEAELLQLLGRDEQAVATYQRLVDRVGDPVSWSNPWVSLKQLRTRLLSSQKEYLRQEKFAFAVQLAAAVAPVASQVHSVRLRAEAYQTWADRLREQAAPLSEADAAPLLAEARQHLRQAGRTYARLSQMRRATREYPDDVWSSGQAYLHGQDFVHAERMLREYLKHGTHQQRRADALVSLGQALLSLGEFDEALTPLSECIEFYAKDPACYQARIDASRAYLEKNDVEQAKQVLLDNLRASALTPRSVEWRQSLFELGTVHYLEGIQLEMQSRALGIDQTDNSDAFRAGLKELEKAAAAFRQAISRLSEAVQRYPDSPRVIESRYQIAQSYRQCARLQQMKERTATIETSRVALNRQFQQDTNGALRFYREIQTTLTEKAAGIRLSHLEERVLRNTYFALGAMLYDLNQLDEAIRAYSSATNRYQNEPVALEALMQIADCYRQLNRPIEARGTLEQAKVVLARIPDDKDFLGTTRYSRVDWKQALDWLSRL